MKKFVVFSLIGLCLASLNSVLSIENFIVPAENLENQEKIYPCGLLPPENWAAIEAVALTLTGPTPDRWDWRDNGDWTTPTRNQGGAPVCWAFGTLAAVEARINIELDDPYYDIDLSEQYMISCSPGNCDGWYMRDALNWLKNHDAILETSLPYEGRHNPRSVEDYENEKVVDVIDWKWISSDRTSIKNALINYGLLPTGMEVYGDFSDYDGGVYRHRWGELRARHLVTIVGYDDIAGYWICKNSWGADWGEGGWFRIAYGECGIEKETAAFVEVKPLLVAKFIIDIPIENFWIENFFVAKILVENVIARRENFIIPIGNVRIENFVVRKIPIEDYLTMENIKVVSPIVSIENIEIIEIPIGSIRIGPENFFVEIIEVKKDWLGVSLTLKAIPTIKAGESIEIGFEGVDITEITIGVVKDVRDVTLTFQQIERLEDIEVSPPSHMYRYFNIATNIEPSIDFAYFEFRVERSWIIEKNIDELSVTLNRYAGGIWEPLPTQKISEDLTFIYYSAGTLGFSVFAVTGEEKTPINWPLIGGIVVAMVTIGVIILLSKRTKAMKEGRPSRTRGES